MDEAWEDTVRRIGYDPAEVGPEDGQALLWFSGWLKRMKAAKQAKDRATVVALIKESSERIVTPAEEAGGKMIGKVTATSKPDACPNCDGSGGFGPAWDHKVCSACDGSGKRPQKEDES